MGMSKTDSLPSEVMALTTKTVVSFSGSGATTTTTTTTTKDDEKKRTNSKKKTGTATSADHQGANGKKNGAEDGSAIVDNPYINVVSKRMRTLKKKLDKIKAMETSVLEGKILNEQQLEVLSNKDNIEKLLAELESVRSLLYDVHISESSNNKEELESGLANRVEKPEMKTTSTTTTTMAPSSMECTPNSMDTKKLTTEEMPLTKNVASSEDDFTHVETLLKLLHVVTLQKALGKTLPSPLDFFVKVLLGTTRPPAELSFEENLTESMDEAKRFLKNSRKEVALDTSYQQLQELVESLIGGDKKDDSPSTPSFNFFTDSIIQPTHLDDGFSLNATAQDKTLVENQTDKDSFMVPQKNALPAAASDEEGMAMVVNDDESTFTSAPRNRSTGSLKEKHKKGVEEKEKGKQPTQEDDLPKPHVATKEKSMSKPPPISFAAAASASTASSTVNMPTKSVSFVKSSPLNASRETKPNGSLPTSFQQQGPMPTAMPPKDPMFRNKKGRSSQGKPVNMNMSNGFVNSHETKLRRPQRGSGRSVNTKQDILEGGGEKAVVKAKASTTSTSLQHE